MVINYVNRTQDMDKDPSVRFIVVTKFLTQDTIQILDTDT